MNYEDNKGRTPLDPLTKYIPTLAEISTNAIHQYIELKDLATPNFIEEELLQVKKTKVKKIIEKLLKE